MKVLVACEFSGIVRDAFIEKGHDAWSCDLLATDSPGNHYQCDIRDVLNMEWDLMIAHPPCTHLSVSGARWFDEKRKDGRQQSAIDFFMLFTKTKIPKVCIENPIGIMSTIYKAPRQVIQPYYFGHPEFKATCFWLKGLPRLNGTEYLSPPVRGDEDWNKWNRVHKCPPGPQRAKLRSWRYPKIANAMADQWGSTR